MKARTTHASPGEQGFSLIELMIVVVIIGIMAGVAIPSIAVYIRNYKINGTEREVSSTIASARSRAISRNTQAGVSFEVVDANTYRIVVEDGLAAAPGELHDLPSGVIFEPPPSASAPNATYFRFNRLGAWCDPFTSTPTNTCPKLVFPCTDARCTDSSPGGSYITSNDPTLTGSIVGLRETNSSLRRVIRVDPGGRVQTVPQ